MNDHLSLQQEKNLISRCKRDLTVFEGLYKYYVKDVYRYVFVIVKDKEIAEDITSQTFLLALEKIKSFQWRGISIKYWFLKIAKNVVRSQGHKRKEVGLGENIQIKDIDAMLLEEYVIEEELKAKLKDLILRLDPLTREIISLRIWEGMKFREIAAFLRMKQITVISRFSRGIVKMQKLLEKEEQMKKDKGKKLYSFNLAVILVGIKYLKRFPDFLPHAEFVSNLAGEIHNHILHFNNTYMEKTGTRQFLQGIKQSRSKQFLLGFALTFLMAAVGIGGYFMFDNLRSDNTTIEVTDDDENNEEVSEVSQDNDVEKTPQKVNKFVFIKKPQGLEGDWESWVSDWDGKNQQKLNIDSNREIYYHSPGTDWVLFNENDHNKGYKLYAYNIYTSKTLEVTFDNTTDAVADPKWYGISPDGRIGLIDLYYLGPIGGWEPSQFDPFPEANQGLYTYDFSNQQITYVGDVFQLSNWDLDSEHFYLNSGYNYHDIVDLSDGHYKVNAYTGEAELIKGLDPFAVGYMEYYINAGTVIIRDAVDEDYNGWGRPNHTITVFKDGASSIIDEEATVRTTSGRYGITEVYISPDQEHIIYTKEDHVAGDNTCFKISLLSLETLEKEDILVPEKDEYFGQPYWVNNDHFIITVRPSEEDLDSGDIMLVNINTGKTERLTDDGVSFLLSTPGQLYY